MDPCLPTMIPHSQLGTLGEETPPPHANEQPRSLPRTYETVDAQDLRNFRNQGVETSPWAYSVSENTAYPPGDGAASSATETTALDREGVETSVTLRPETTTVSIPPPETVAGTISELPIIGEAKPLLNTETSEARAASVNREPQNTALSGPNATADSREDGTRQLKTAIEHLRVANQWALAEAKIRDLIAAGSLSTRERGFWAVERAYCLLILEKWQDAFNAINSVSGAAVSAKGAYCLAEASLNLGFTDTAETNCERAINLYKRFQGRREENLLNDCVELLLRIKDALGKPDEAEAQESKLPPNFTSTLANQRRVFKTLSEEATKARIVAEMEHAIRESNAIFTENDCQLALEPEPSDPDKGILESAAYRIQGSTKEYFRAFEMAAQQQNEKLAEALLLANSHARRVNGDGTTLLHVAAERCKEPKIVQSLLENSHDINAYDSVHKTPLDYAVKHRQLNVVSLLLRSGAISGSIANPSSVARPVGQAAFAKDLKMLKLLVEEYQHDVTETIPLGWRTPLIAAVLPASWVYHAYRGEGFTGSYHLSDSEVKDLDDKAIEVVGYLFEHGAAGVIDEIDAERRTAIHHAVSIGLPKTTEFLLSQGADARIKLEGSPLYNTKNGFKVWIYFKRGKRYKEIRRLLDEHSARENLKK